MTFTLAVEMKQINCGECGGSYAISERYRSQKQTEGKTWNCPYCKVSWGYAKSEIQEVRKQLKAAENKLVAERASHDQTKSALHGANIQATKKANELKRVKTRVHNGVCPCCNRSFANLRRHMTTKHPEYQTAEASE